MKYKLKRTCQLNYNKLEHFVQNHAIQADGYNCGIYVLTYIKCYFENKPINQLFNKYHADNKRKDVQQTLLFKREPKCYKYIRKFLKLPSSSVLSSLQSKVLLYQVDSGNYNVRMNEFSISQFRLFDGQNFRAKQNRDKVKRLVYLQSSVQIFTLANREIRKFQMTLPSSRKVKMVKTSY